MQALQLVARNQLEHCVLPTPQPGPHQVLVKTLATTICTSDLHDISRNPFGITLPRVLGHEAAGIVVASGAQVSRVDIGALVAIHPVVNCGECEECRRGLTHHCQQLGHLGFDRDGCFAEYIVQREDRVRVLPPNVSAHVGTLLEPLCVCLQAVARAGDLTQRTVLVVGDGPFGIIIARMALRAGGKVILVGREEFRLKQVPTAIALHWSSVEESLHAVRARVGMGGMDVAILAVSSKEAFDLCLSALRPRGRLVLFSALGKDDAVDLQRVHLRELELVGACNDEARLDEAVGLLSECSTELSHVITHQVPFRDWPRAFELARNHHHEVLKVSLTFPEL
jgi:threonine dehydrogenase-like Zn-dependent dehydrogenase